MKSISQSRSPILVAIVTAIAVWAAFAADDNPDPKAPFRQQNAGIFTKIPAKYRGRPNPLASDPDAIAAGKKLFALRCAECHGEGARGGRKAPSLRIEQVQGATPGELFWILSNGIVRRGMPDWSKLPEVQRWQIVTYIQSLSRRSGFASEVVSEESSTKQ